MLHLTLQGAKGMNLLDPHLFGTFRRCVSGHSSDPATIYDDCESRESIRDVIYFQVR